MNLLARPPELVEPADIAPSGGADDAARIQVLLDEHAYERAIELQAGTYQIAETIVVPSGSVIIGGPGVRLVSTIPESGSPGSPEAAVFYAAPPVPTVTTTLTADTVPGSTTIEVTSAAGLLEGMEIAILDENHGAGYVIADVTGTTITLDRTIMQVFASADSIVVDRIAPKDIHILGNGMVITGTGDAAIELAGAWRCHVSGLRIEDAVFAFVGVNFDVGARDCTIRDCIFLCGGGVLNGWHFEDAERCYAEHVYSSGATGYGMFVTSGWGNIVDGCEARLCASGGALVTRAVGTIGGHSVTFQGCRFVDNTGPGLAIESGSEHVSVMGCHAAHNGGAGFAVNLGTAASRDVCFSACVANANQNGFVIAAGCTGVMIGESMADLCTQYGITNAGDLIVNGFISRNCTLGGVLHGTGELHIDGFGLSASFNGGWAALTVQTGGRAHISSGLITMSGTGTKIALSHSSTSVSHVRDVRTVGGTYGWISSGGFLRRGPDLDFSSCGTPFFPGGGVVSFGELTLNGATPVEHAFTDTKATDRPRARRTTLAGTPAPYIVEAVAGVGIRVTGTAGDTSKIEVDLI